MIDYLIPGRSKQKKISSAENITILIYKLFLHIIFRKKFLAQSEKNQEVKEIINLWKPQTIEIYMKLQLLELSDSDYKITVFTVFKEIQQGQKL